MTIVEFLLARIAEDEATATNQGRFAGDQWTALEPDPGHVSAEVLGRGRGLVVMALHWEAEHIARHDPARVLTECEAKRRVVRAAHQAIRTSDEVPEDELDEVNNNGRKHGYAQALEFVLENMALPYAEHPDYQQEWTI